MLPQGRRLGIDYGDVRIGVAITDAAAILASPLSTHSGDSAIQEIVEIIEENLIHVVYIGLPLHLSGNESNSSAKAREFALTLKTAVSREVTFRMIDERLSTKTATQNSQLVGKSVSKENIDQLAAASILEFALSVERSQGILAGHEI